MKLEKAGLAEAKPIAKTARPAGAPAEHVHVLIVGAGISGIDAAYHRRGHAFRKD